MPANEDNGKIPLRVPAPLGDLQQELEGAFSDDPPITRDHRRRGLDVSRETSTEPVQIVSPEAPAPGISGTPFEDQDVSRETAPTKPRRRRRPAGSPSTHGTSSVDPHAVERPLGARVIAVVNQKGGVGKTTTAVNLAACLAAAERRTLLVDLDPQGNATSGVGISKDALPASIYDVLVNDVPLDEAVVTSVIAFLDVVPATVDLFGAEIELVSAIGREHRLRAALDGVRDRYDFILVDCPPSLGLLTLNALAAVDSVLIPIQCEYYALEGLSQLLGTIRIVQKSLNPRLAIEGVLLTMYDARLNLARQVQDEAVEYFGKKVYATVIPRNVRLSEAPSFGQPVILYDILSAGAVSYMKLATEVIEA